MYPNITLKITNHIPQLIYYPEEGMSRVMTSEEENLQELIQKLATDLDLIKHLENNDNVLADLLMLAEEGDERLIEEIPEKNNQYLKNFGLEKMIFDELEKARSEKEVYELDEKISEEVLEELNKNQNVDILATMLEMIYNLIILKTLSTASELGIGNIHLDDKSGMIRLRQKMASELSKLDIELKIVE